MTQPDRVEAGAVWRLLAYTAGVALLGWVLKLYARHGGVEAFLKDWSMVEYGQLALLGTSMMVLFGAAWRSHAPRRLACTLAGILTAIAFAREHNNQLILFEPWLGWKTLVLALFATGSVLAWLGRQYLGSAVTRFSGERAFYLLWAGFATILFAQTLGHGGFLEPLFGEEYIRAYKRVIEEGLELFGYYLILCGSIEAALKREASD